MILWIIKGFESPMLHQRHVAAPDHQGRTVICQTPYRDGEVRIWTRILCQVGKIPEMQMLSAFPGFFIVVLRGQNQNSDLKNLFKKTTANSGCFFCEVAKEFGRN